MKIRYYKLFLTLCIIALVVAFFVWKSITPKNVLTEAETAEILICYLQSLDDCDSDIAICDDDLDIIREWPSEDGTVIFQISSEGLENHDPYCIFGYYSRLNKEQGCNYYSFIDYYAVNQETGEIVEQQEWNESDVALNNCSVGQGMSEEEATKVLFHYLFPEDSFDSKGDCYTNSTGHMEYEWWDDFHTRHYFWCEGLSEKKIYYIFEYWSDLYEGPLEDGTYRLLRYYYSESYAVNKWNGEIVEERINDREADLWEYNEEYYEIIKPSR